MKKIKQKIIIATVGLILLIILMFINMPNLVTGKITSNNNYLHSWTKAICNETQCQDYEIYCNGNKLINQTAITGAVMNVPEDWIDPRNETNRERVCE
jgi:hypothetical protein